MLQARINYNIEQSVPLFVKEGLYPNLLSRGDMISTQADNWSETIILQSSMYMNSKEDPLAIFNNAWIHDNNILQGFIRASEGEAPNSSYYRYWQGFRVLIRPLLAMFDYSAIRELFRFFGWFLFCLTAMVLYRSTGGMFTLIFCASLLWTGYGVVTTSIQFSLCFFIALLAMILLPQMLKRQYSIAGFFFFVGAATQFFDFYTVPCVTLGLPLVYFIELKKREPICCQSVLASVMGCVAAWFGAYAGMWICRMALVSLFLHIDAFSSTFNSLFRWTGIVEEATYAWIGPLDAIGRAFQTAFTKAHTALLLGSFLVYAMFLVRAILRHHARKPDWMFLPVALIPIVWMIAASKPTTWHIFFQYRSLVVFLFACGAFAVSMLEMKTMRYPDMLVDSEL